MDVPFEFASISPNLQTLLKEFEVRNHPFVPELNLCCLPKKNDAIKQQLTSNHHSWQWPYLWECGAALARWVLDNDHIVKDKLVYDIGTGLGTVAVAAAKAGAKISVGIDCCVYSRALLDINSDLNKVVTVGYHTDLFEAKIPLNNTVLLASDLVYGQQTSDQILDYLHQLSSDVTVVLSVSGRNNPSYQIKHPGFHHITNYSVPCFTPGLETVETMPVSLWTCNSLILKDL